MFKEFTLVDTYTQTEVMVYIDINSGRIVGLYCYRDDIPVIENYETDKIYKITTRDGLNPLFVHINRKAHIYKLLLTNGFIFCLDEDDTDYETDVSLIEKSLTFYGLSSISNIY